MSKNIFNAYSILIFLTFFNNTFSKYDLTVVGPCLMADGVGQLAIGVMNCLHKDLKLNYISSRGAKYINLNGVPKAICNVVKNPDKSPGNVSFFIDGVWYKNQEFYKTLPESEIKIALSMIETSELPQEWIDILNTQFDAIVVPDKHLVEVYQKSGIVKPIFILPCGVFLSDLLQQKLKPKNNKKFIFGSSGGLWDRKNQSLLIKAFAQEFGNDPKIILKVHARFGIESVRKSLKDYLKKNNFKNIELIEKSYTRQDYIDFLNSLNAYVLISKGEGFSISPREAMALGVPCILSNNTTHKTICNSGLVIPVKSEILEPADYTPFFGKYCGNFHNCLIGDVRKALRKMYKNYGEFKSKALSLRKWACQYSYNNLKPYYMTLMKPEKIVLGEENLITKDVLITNSLELYNKYQKVITKEKNEG